MELLKRLGILVCILSANIIGIARTQPYSFADYIKAGLKFDCTIAIDLSASRPEGNARHPSSAPTTHSYETVLSLLVETLKPLVLDDKFFVFGFGAELSSCSGDATKNASHGSNTIANDFCFGSDVLKTGVRGVLESYRDCINQTKVSETAHFAPVVRRAIDVARYTGSFSEKYFILVIVTDGTITDMQETIETIVEAATSEPISIIIVGVGSNNFYVMELMDGDFTRLEANGKKASRDIVHFVQFNGDNIASDTAKEALAELPKQVVYFMRSHAKDIESKFKSIDRTALQNSSVADALTSDVTVVEKIQKLLEQATRKNTFYANVDTIKVISAGNGELIAEMVVEEKHVNLYGTLHGGCTATIVDICTGLALGTHPTPGTGVSIDIHMSYMNPGKLNDTIVIEASTIKVGRTLAFAEATIKSKTTGAVVARGSHTKYVDNTSGKFSVLDFSN